MNSSEPFDATLWSYHLLSLPSIKAYATCVGGAFRDGKRGFVA